MSKPIYGNTTATPNAIPDWNQTDNTKADFIKNKPIVATLESGKIPASQLPSYVDDVLEYDGKETFPTSGEAGKVYIDTKTNITYRWSGTTYAVIGSDLALGETASTAYYGDKGKQAYEHSQITNGNPHGITKEKLGVVETYTNAEPLIKDMGGILVKNHKQGFADVPITDLITELLYPYTKPVIDSFTLNPGAGVKEKNVALTVNSATVKVTKKSKTIASVDLYKGNTKIASKTDEVTSSGTTLTFNINEVLDGATDSVSYTVKVVEAGENANIVTSTQTYSFVYPYFYGTVAKDTEVTSDIITTFTKSIRSKGENKYTYALDDSCPVIAYPKSYGELKDIKDPNTFSQIWESNTVIVNGVEYYVYIGSHMANPLTVEYIFKYEL